MKTKQIPVIIMLIAGLVMSIAGVINRIEAVEFLKTLVIVLILFYVLGCIAKLILDKNFKEEGTEAREEAVEEEMEEKTLEESTEEEKK